MYASFLPAAAQRTPSHDDAYIGAGAGGGRADEGGEDAWEGRGVGEEMPGHQRRKCWVSLTLREGKNREIRRVVESCGWQVARLIRVRCAECVVRVLSTCFQCVLNVLRTCSVHGAHVFCTWVGPRVPLAGRRAHMHACEPAESRLTICVLDDARRTRKVSSVHAHTFFTPPLH